MKERASAPLGSRRFNVREARTTRWSRGWTIRQRGDAVAHQQRALAAELSPDVGRVRGRVDGTVRMSSTQRRDTRDPNDATSSERDCGDNRRSLKNRLRCTAAHVAFVALALILASCAGTPAVSYTSAGTSTPSASWSFDQDPKGAPPTGSQVFAGDWVVRAEGDAPTKPNVLCQVGRAEFPAIALSSAVYGDLTVTVRFKPISGREDQAAGIIFRVQDKDNYYILRANALEGNVNLYLYASGRRSDIKDGTARVASGQWQELRVEATGDRLRGFLNGQLVVEATDGSYKAGRVGLWTKADSVTCFDDVIVKPAGA